MDFRNGGNFSKIDDNGKFVYGPMVDYGGLFGDAKPQFSVLNLNRHRTVLAAGNETHNSKFPFRVLDLDTTGAVCVLDVFGPIRGPAG